MRAEFKEDMAKRGVKSPDRGDAILGSIMCGSHMLGSISAETVAGMDMDDSGFDSDTHEF